MRLYKLTDQNHQTFGRCQWGEGVEHTASGEGGLCGPGWLHAYTHPLLAVLLNSIHAGISNPVLWEADGDVGKTDRGLKVGCTRLKTIRQIPLPAVTNEQRARFAILCAKAAYATVKFGFDEWNAWADGWLAGTDRSCYSAQITRHSPGTALWAASCAAEGVNGSASWESEWADHCVEEWVAWAATRAIDGTDIDLIAIAEEAVNGGHNETVEALLPERRSEPH